MITSRRDDIQKELRAITIAGQLQLVLFIIRQTHLIKSILTVRVSCYRNLYHIFVRNIKIPVVQLFDYLLGLLYCISPNQECVDFK